MLQGEGTGKETIHGGYQEVYGFALLTGLQEVHLV